MRVRWIDNVALSRFPLLLLSLHQQICLKRYGLADDCIRQFGFSPLRTQSRLPCVVEPAPQLFDPRMESEMLDEAGQTSCTGKSIQVPDTGFDMVLQCQAAVERAFAAGLVRQTVRFAVLPPDESIGGVTSQLWDGGSDLVYERSHRPHTENLLRRLRANKALVGTPLGKVLRPQATVTTRVVSDWEGSGVSEARSQDDDPNEVVSAATMFGTDASYLSELEALDAKVGSNNLLLLVNPNWLGLENWGLFNLLQPRAKERAAAAIFDRPLETRYELTYQCWRCVGVKDRRFAVCIKAFPYDWQVFAYHLPEDAPSYGYNPIRVGSFPTTWKPSVDDVGQLIGLHPEFAGIS